MKRFHVSLSVSDLAASIAFYSELFAAAPAVRRDDYAKWMVDEPPLNFSLTTRGGEPGRVGHVGIESDDGPGQDAVGGRLRRAGALAFEEPLVDCCYARSSKTWVADPDGLRWEAFLTHEQLADPAPQAFAAPAHEELAGRAQRDLAGPAQKDLTEPARKELAGLAQKHLAEPAQRELAEPAREDRAEPARENLAGALERRAAPGCCTP